VERPSELYQSDSRGEKKMPDPNLALIRALIQLLVKTGSASKITPGSGKTCARMEKASLIIEHMFFID
jgi:hypothetical protein